MTIDNSPAIKAFILERLSLLHSQHVPNDAVEELQLILKLIDGLVAQNKVLSKELETDYLPPNIIGTIGRHNVS